MIASQFYSVHLTGRQWLNGRARYGTFLRSSSLGSVFISERWLGIRQSKNYCSHFIRGRIMGESIIKP